MKDAKSDWRTRCRRYLAVAFGARCTICGYDKTIAALDYHHVFESEKDKELSRAMRNGHAWSKIVEEARKCTLVCCRCHREIHAGVTDLPQDYTRFNEEYADVVKLRQKEFDQCPVCKNEKPKTQSFCSHRCSQKSQKRFDVSKEELEVLVAKLPLTKIAAMFNVSDTAIRKRCKSLGIDIKKLRV